MSRFLVWVAIAALFAQFHSMGIDLDSYRYKSRLFVILSPDEKNAALQSQEAEVRHHARGFQERDLVVLTETVPNGELHERFKVTGDIFRVLLIGKDGHVVLSEAKPIGSDRLFALIDAMPMRQEEMRKAQTPNR
jgi:Domain of unknown function (DUF4174)